MNKRVSKFLEFNGKTIYFVASDGVYWIAVKPICEALNVEYTRQFKNIKKDEILGPALATQPMQAPDNQLRNYAALPENLVYGWLMQIQSSSPELQKYKWECYQVLYNHFHGTITGRKELLSAKAKAQLEMDEVMNTLGPDLALKYDRAKRRRDQITAELRKLDQEVINEEFNLFQTENF
jgi:hypothetical protein